MHRWLIRLKGHPFDLERLEETLTSPQVQVFEQEGHYYLWSPAIGRFETEREIYCYAAGKLIPAINGLMRTHYPDFCNVEVDGVAKEAEDGSITHFVFAEVKLQASARVRCKASVVRVEANGTVVDDSPEPTKPTKEGRWAGVLLEDERCLDAFRLFGTKPNDWATLYKVLEIVESDGAPVTSWVSKNKVESFTRTANSPDAIGDDARHANRKKCLPPSKPMSIQEAQNLIRTILYRWIDSKVSS